MTIRKTQILLTVLHDSAFPLLSLSLEQIAAEMDNGEIIGATKELDHADLPVGQVRAELLEIGNDGTFFVNPSLDGAEAEYRADPNEETGAAWLASAIQYADDGMITEAEVEMIRLMVGG